MLPLNRLLTWLNWLSNWVTELLAWLIAAIGYTTSCSYLATVCCVWLIVLSGAATYVLISDSTFDSAAMIAARSTPNCPLARPGRNTKAMTATAAAFHIVGRYQ